MHKIKNIILLIFIVVLTVMDGYCADLSGISIGKQVNYTRGADTIISIKDNPTGISVLSNEVNGQSNFGQYRVQIGAEEYYYSILDTGDNSTVDGIESLRQETFVRANENGPQGTFFEQDFVVKENGFTGACLFETSTINNVSCLDTKINFKGLDVAGQPDRDFSITMTLSEKGAGIVPLRDYQQQFGYNHLQAESDDTSNSIVCKFKSGINCAGKIKDPLTELFGTVTSPASARPNELSRVFFRDSIRVSNDESNDNKYEYEAMDKNAPPEGKVEDNHYRYQLF